MPIWFELFFFLMVVAFEIYWMRQHRKESKEFEAYKADVYNQLAELGERLEIVIEGVDTPKADQIQEKPAISAQGF